MSYTDEQHQRRRERAGIIAAQLCGREAPPNVVRALLGLVVADERTDIPREERPGPDPGARQILHRKKPQQEGLW